MVGRCFQLDVPIFNPNFRHQLVDLDLLHPLRVRHFLALCLHVHLRVSFVPEEKSIELEDVAALHFFLYTIKISLTEIPFEVTSPVQRKQ